MFWTGCLGGGTSILDVPFTVPRFLVSGFILDDIVDQFDPFRVCHLSIERVSSIGECKYVARP